jgi:hypothetical protein
MAPFTEMANLFMKAELDGSAASKNEELKQGEIA